MWDERSTKDLRRLGVGVGGWGLTGRRMWAGKDARSDISRKARVPCSRGLGAEVAVLLTQSRCRPRIGRKGLGTTMVVLPKLVK